MRRVSGITAVLLSATLAAGGCDPGTGTDDGPATLTFTTAPSGEQVVGTQVPTTVRVTTASGSAVPGADVTFAVTTGGGSVTPTAVATDQAGSASTTWTLGTAPGRQRLEASVPSLEAVATEVTTVPGPIEALAANPDTVTLDALADTVTVEVVAVDAYGNTVSDPTVEWISSDPTVVSVAAGAVVAVGNGTAEVVVVAGDAADTVEVTVAQVAVGVEVTPAADTLHYQVPAQLTATVVDANGYAMDGVGVTWSSLDPSVATVDASGTVTGVDLGPVGIEATADLGAARTGTAAALIGEAAYRIAPAPWDALASLDRHTCALDVDGRARCWGLNGVGQLGTGTTSLAGSFAPQAVSGGHAFVRIYAGREHACALTVTGDAYCWGDNGLGQLGDGTAQDRWEPVAVSGGHTFRRLTLGAVHTCGITDTGHAYCWGRNSAGQLGVGSSYYSENAPTAVSTSATFSQLAAGSIHTCGLSTEGDIYCWGLNVYGQFGDGTTSATQVPTPENLGNPYALETLVSGLDHACGLTGAGEAYCWGRNTYGQVGDGGPETEQKPTPVRAAAGRTFVRLGAGTAHTCGVGADGAVSCWGNGANGQLGHGSWETVAGPVTFAAPEPGVAVALGYQSTCQLSAAGAGWCSGSHWYGELGTAVPFYVPAPVAVQADPGLAWLTSGGGGTCGATASGSVYCWGAAAALPVDGAGVPVTPEPTAYTAPADLTDVVLGTAHGCGLDAAGVAYCWGDNYYGQVGDGTATFRGTPVAVSGSRVFAGLAAGAYHTCGFTGSGQAYCWGSNVHGQLGDGTTINRSTPVAVGGGHTITALALGQWHSCALDDAGAALCWGSNHAAQLGGGTTDFSSAAPVAVSGGHAFVALTAGYSHACGITAAGAGYCWGLAGHGQLGDGTGAGADGPTAVSGGHVFQQLGSFGNTTCGRVEDGTGYCWGGNQFGQVGDGTTENRLAPTAVGGGMVFTDLAPGYDHTCGLAADGTTYCWGHLGWGYLGNGEAAYHATPQPVATDGFALP